MARLILSLCVNCDLTSKARPMLMIERWVDPIAVRAPEGQCELKTLFAGPMLPVLWHISTKNKYKKLGQIISICLL